jgi:hypothetical protein
MIHFDTIDLDYIQSVWAQYGKPDYYSTDK